MSNKFDKPDGYDSWSSMKQRCANPKHHRYPNYGGRGISYCPEWEDFKTFIADMGPRPSPKYSLERKDNSGDYTPDNCKWATQLEQCNNRRDRVDNKLGERGITLHPTGLYYVKLTKYYKSHVSKGIKVFEDAVELRNHMLEELA